LLYAHFKADKTYIVSSLDAFKGFKGLDFSNVC